MKIYYKFWLTSSRGTDELTVRMYDRVPNKEELKDDCEQWASGFGAWTASENVCDYGWKRLKNLPKNRKEALKKHTEACEKYHYWENKRKFFFRLLCCPPFDGSKK